MSMTEAPSTPRAPALACLAAILWPAGCSLSADVAVVPSEGSESLLVVRVPEGGPPELAALSLAGEGAGARTSIPAPDRGELLYVLLYRCSFEALGLERSTIKPSSGTGRPLPWPERALRNDGGDSWTEVDVNAVPSLRELRIDAGPEYECLDTVTRTVDLPRDDRVMFAVPLGGAEVFIGTSLGKFLRFDVESLAVTPVVQLSTTTPHRGAAAWGDEIWLLGEDGRTQHGRPEALVEGPRMAAPPYDSCIDTVASPADAPFELFTLGCTGKAEHFDGTRWRVLDETGLEGHLESIVWLSRGRALGVGPNTPQLSRFEAEGRVVGESVRLDLNDRPATLTAHPRGVLVGTEGGQIVLRDGDGGWTPLASTLDRHAPGVVLPLGDGFIYGGYEGIFWQWQEQVGRCSRPLSVPLNAFMGLRVQDKAVILTEYEGHQVIHVVEEKAKPNACP